MDELECVGPPLESSQSKYIFDSQNNYKQSVICSITHKTQPLINNISEILASLSPFFEYPPYLDQYFIVTHQLIVIRILISIYQSLFDYTRSHLLYHYSNTGLD